MFILDRQHWKEIVAHLESKGLLLGIDLFLWEQGYPTDTNVAAFIAHNKKIWHRDNSVARDQLNKNKVIVAVNGAFHDIYIVQHAYCANYLADTYDAEIVAFLPFVRERDMMCLGKSARDVARSYGVNDVLSFECDEQQLFRAKQLFLAIWDSVNDWSDLRELTIEGISLGNTFIREYLRFYTPSLNLKTASFKQYLQYVTPRVIFLLDYFKENDVKAVILWDGVCRDGLLRDIAITNGAKAYIVVHGKALKLAFDFSYGGQLKYYKDFFYQLSPREQEIGIEWARRSLEARLNGDNKDVAHLETLVYSMKQGARVLEQNEKLKVVICPSTFGDDLCTWGWQVFGSFVEWLNHLGQLSNQTDYDWYIKLHPIATVHDDAFYNDYLKKYPQIKMVPRWTSPRQLKDEGIKFAFTVYGTLGHEYPALGIQVINAGNNPHIAFDFCYNPRTPTEFDEIVFNLPNLVDRKIDLQDVYRFYCIHYLYYKRHGLGDEVKSYFFKRPELYQSTWSAMQQRHVVSTSDRVKRYRTYLDDWTPEFHELTKRKVSELFQKMDDYRDDVFYKNDADVIKKKLIAVGINAD